MGEKKLLRGFDRRGVTLIAGVWLHQAPLFLISRDFSARRLQPRADRTRSPAARAYP